MAVFRDLFNLPSLGPYSYRNVNIIKHFTLLNYKFNVISIEKKLIGI